MIVEITATIARLTIPSWHPLPDYGIGGGHGSGRDRAGNRPGPLASQA